MGRSRKNRNRKNKANKSDIKTSDYTQQETIVSKPINSGNLKKNIDHFIEYSEKYAPAKVEPLKKILKDLDNQEYKIAVVANMSAGKSTFINALFGVEVLPAFNHATTDCATFIYSEPDIDKRAIIYFSDNKEPVEIRDDLEREIKQYAQKDEECEDDKYKNVEMIELFYPFKNLQTTSSEDFKITFIDTPGPNSTGDGYKQKHKDQTRKVLNDVDLALFTFDYTQLDANWESDEQGLWNTIKKRHEKDDNFDVYFIINKIDYALNDNFKDMGKLEDKEYKQYKLDHWFKHEKTKIEKLQKAANKHNISNPKIYPISSKFQLLSRDKDINWDLQDELDAFKESHFRRPFGEEWEDKFIEYLGIVKLEKDINEYIDSSVKEKIIKKLDSNFFSIWNDEKNSLETRIQTLQKPKEEAQQNLRRANYFLQIQAKKMQKEMKRESLKKQKEYEELIGETIDSAIKRELIDKIDEISRLSIAFAQDYARDNNKRMSTKKAKKTAHLIKLDENIVEIKISKEIDIKSVMAEMQTYMLSLFEEYKNNYLDVKTDLKEIFFDFERDSKSLFQQYKDELEQELGKNLDTKIEALNREDIEKINIPKTQISIPGSVLDYDYDTMTRDVKATRKVKRGWYNPARWFGDKYVNEEYTKKVTSKTHKFIIAPKKLRRSISDSIDQSISDFSENEKSNYTKQIKTTLYKNLDIFQDFRHTKQREIDKLQEDIKIKESSLKEIKSQYDEFKKIREE